MNNIIKAVEPKAMDWINHSGTVELLYQAIQDAFPRLKWDVSFLFKNFIK